jgi:hypothetical protein
MLEHAEGLPGWYEAIEATAEESLLCGWPGGAVAEVRRGGFSDLRSRP